MTQEFKAHSVANKPAALKPMRSKGTRAISQADLERAAQNLDDSDASADRPREIGGPKGPEPTRYGDWEVGGIASDF